MKILTASFKTYRAGPGRISIARWPPRGFPAGYRVLKTLAPGPWFKSVDREEYNRRFSQLLGELDPHQVMKQLQQLAGRATPVLLCWEEPPFTADNWCHRRLVADWLSAHLQIVVPELDPAAAEAHAQQQQLVMLAPQLPLPGR